jgi:anoctamin-7
MSPNRWLDPGPLTWHHETVNCKALKVFNQLFSFNISGFYTGWLLPAAVVGLVVFLYGVLTMNSNTIAVETCLHGDQYLMCPLCESCTYWQLSDICQFKRVAYLFDHPGTVFYAIFMSFWGKLTLQHFYRVFQNYWTFTNEFDDLEHPVSLKSNRHT